MTNLEYRAFRKAARLIERNKQRYNFWEGKTPTEERGQGCPAAWIGYYLGMDSYAGEVTKERLGVSLLVFLERLGVLVGEAWQENHRLAAKALRLYADKYYRKEVKVRKSTG